MIDAADAVVVGSGPNGLAAAIRLAEAGLQVVVLEGQDRPGGAVRTAELTLPGFHHDVFSAVHPAGAASPVFARMPLAEHGLEWVHPEACFAHPLPDGRAAVLHRDVERTVRSLDALSAGDGARWAAFAAPYLEHFEAVRDTMLAEFPPVAGPLRLLTGAGPRHALEFGRLLPGRVVDLAGRLFAASGARAWLSGAALHGDAPPTGAGSAIAGFYLNLLGHAVGWPSPRGGAERITDALVGHLRALGGDVRTDARVTHIHTSAGRVAGVSTARGEHVAAPVVVADVLPHALLALTGDAIGGWYRAVASRFHYGAATIKVDWALDGPIPWTNAATRTAGTVHVAGDEPEFLDAIRTMQRGLPERPFLLLGQQSIADPSRAPADRHTAWAYTHAPRRGIDWAVERDRHVARIEAQVERFAPGFRDRIIGRHVLAPRDLEARNPNLVGGDVGAGSYRLRQVLFRPIPRLSPYTTPVDGLYLGSASTFPGGAVHGVPGDAAARAALRHLHRGAATRQ